MRHCMYSLSKQYEIGKSYHAMDKKIFDHISILRTIREKNRKITDQFHKKMAMDDEKNELLVNILERKSSFDNNELEMEHSQRNSRPSLVSIKSSLSDSVVSSLADSRKKSQSSRKRKSLGSEPKTTEQSNSHGLHGSAINPALQIQHYATLINALNQQFIAANPLLVQNYMAQYIMSAATVAAAAASEAQNTNEKYTNHQSTSLRNGIYQKRESPNSVSTPLSDSIHKLSELNIGEINDKASGNSAYETQSHTDYDSSMKEDAVDLSYGNSTQRKKSRSDIYEDNYEIPPSTSRKSSATSSCSKPTNNYVIIPKKFMPLISTRIKDWLDKLINLITASPKLINLSNDAKLTLLEGCWHRLLLTYMIENDFEFFVTKDLQLNELKKLESIKYSSIDHLPTEADVRQLQTIIEKGHDLGIDDITFEYIRKIILYKEGQGTMHSAVFKDAEAEIQVELKNYLESNANVKIIYSRLLLFLPNVYNVKKEIIEKLFWKYISDDDLFDYLRERMAAHRQ